MDTQRTVLVAGGTGRAGRAYVKAFVDAGYRVRATHRPGKDPEALRALGAAPVVADLRKTETLPDVVEGSDVVVIALFGRGEDAAADEERMTRALVDAAVEGGVERVIFTSVYRGDEPTGVPHFEVKGRLEAYIRESGVGYTVLRPATFMDAFNAPWLRNAVEEEGVVRSPIGPDTPITYIATADLARFAVLALEDERLDGATLELGGPEALAYRDILPVLSDLLGREVEYQQIPLEAVEARQGPDIAAMIRLFNRDGFVVDMAPVLAAFPAELTPLRTFLEQAGWGSVEGEDK